MGVVGLHVMALGYTFSSILDLHSLICTALPSMYHDVSGRLYRTLFSDVERSSWR